MGKWRDRSDDLAGDLADLMEIRDNLKAMVERHKAVQHAVFAEHAPRVVRSRDGSGLELRCTRCRTDEHHTWADANMLLWPCPTLASFVTFASLPEQTQSEPESAPEVEEGQADEPVDP